MAIQSLGCNVARCVLAAGFFVAHVSVADPVSTTNKADTPQNPGQKVSEAVDSIRDYSARQRDDAVQQAKTALGDLDAKISDMEKQMDEKWGQMDQSAREEARATLDDLRKKRAETAEWFGGLKYSSTRAWEEVRNGFVRSFKGLRDGFDKANDR